MAPILQRQHGMQKQTSPLPGAGPVVVQRQRQARGRVDVLKAYQRAEQELLGAQTRAAETRLRQAEEALAAFLLSNDRYGILRGTAT
jgi:hypothetical protein